MSIVEVRRVDNHIVAITQQGQILFWQNPKLSSNAQTLKDFTSLLPCTSHSDIGIQGIKGMQLINHNFIIYNKDTIMFVNKAQLVMDFSTIDKFIQKVPASTILNKQEHINYLVGSGDLLLIGSSSGILYKYKHIQKTTTHFDLNTLWQKVSQDIIFSSQSQSQTHIYILSLLLYCHNQLLLVGLSNGCIVSVNIHQMTPIFVLKNNKASLQPIHRMVLQQNQHKLYCIHQHYITVWNIMLASCIAYYQFYKPKDVLVTAQGVFGVGPYSKIINLDDVNMCYDLSMRCGNVVRKWQNRVVVGGCDGIIDIFQNGLRLVTLFKK